MYSMIMNKNIYNYKHVTEYILPVIDRTKFAYDFAIAIGDKQSYVDKFLGDQFNQIITDVVYYRDTAKSYKNISHIKYPRLWNAYCFTYWSKWHLDQSTIDQWGYIKWKDEMGFAPTAIDSGHDAYERSYITASSEPKYHE